MEIEKRPEMQVVKPAGNPSITTPIASECD